MRIETTNSKPAPCRPRGWERLGGWLVLALGLLLAQSASAAFQDSFAGARFLGLGGASVAIVADTDGLAVNPAGIAHIGDEKATQQVAASYGGLYLGLSDGNRISQSYLAYALATPSRGGVGIAWKRTQAGALYWEDRLAIGAARLVRTHKAKETPPRLAVGVQGELLHWDAAPTIGEDGRVLEDLSGPAAFGVTLGGIYQLSPNVSIGVGFHQLNQPNIASSRSVEGNRLPIQTLFGLGAQAEHFLWAFDILLERETVDVRTGIEWEAQPNLLFLRAGFRLEGIGLGNNLTFGTGVHISPSTRVDYAVWIPVGNVQNTWGSHRVSLLYEF